MDKDFFNYLVATDQLDDFLGKKEDQDEDDEENDEEE